MDLVRSAVLALGLLIGCIGTTQASDTSAAVAVPIHFAAAHAQPGQQSITRTFPGLFAQSSKAQAVQTGPAPDITYGAPYFYGPWYPSGNGCTSGARYPTYAEGPPELTVNAAVADYENQFTACFGITCNWTVLGVDPNDSNPDIFGYVEDGGNCTGDEDIYGTAYSANVGDGNVNGDGEGGKINSASPYVADPINASTGNKYLVQDDYVDTPWLTLRRFYNSNSITPTSFMGPQWRHSFDRSLLIVSNPAATIIMTRPDGSRTTFTKSNGVWTGTVSSVDQLTETDNAQGVATLYTVFIGANRHTETYSTAGLLLSVTDQTGQGITLTYSTSSTPTTIAPSPGLLLTVTDPKNRQLSFSYNSSGLLTQVALPHKGTLTYTYGSNAEGAITAVNYPDGSSKQYLYNESDFVKASSFVTPYLTGIMDENGVRYSSTAYDAENRAVVSLFGGEQYSTYGGANNTQVTYNSDGTSTMTYPLGHTATMGFSQTNGMNQIASLDQSCAPDCHQQWKTRTYDANGYPASQTDFNNVLMTTQYDAYGELMVEVDASGTTSQRTINTTWNSTLREPLTRTVLDVHGNAVTETSWVYNAIGQTLAMCEIDPAKASSYVCATTGAAPAGVRRWTYTYCTTVGSTCPLVGLVLSVTGPRTDLTQTTNYSYYTTSSATSCGTPGAACYQAGDLHTITDALGHVTTMVSYDADGRITRVTDPNGVNTDSTYTSRGWLATRIVGGATTTFTYWPYGAVETVKDPDGVLTTYTYDGAHRLTRITDALGNYVQYTLDGSGNKTAEQTYRTNPITAVRSLSRTYNTLGQLTTVADGLSNTVFNASAAGSYDGNGRLILSTDALGIQREQGLDPLNRLINNIDNYNGTDAATKNTSTTFAYDALNRLVGVTDPTALNTGYTFDGLSNRTELQSPDSASSTDTYDAAGNRLVHTDAKSAVSTSTYDALNRLASTHYTDTTLNVTYTYDEADSVTGCSGAYALGRLTHVVEASVTTAYCYDAVGNVVRKRQYANSQVDITYYAYSLAGRLLRMQYPSGSHLTYGRDGNGHIQSVALVSASGASSTAVSAISYLPFGPISSYTLGNGQVVTRTYDANYRLTDLTSPGFTLHLLRDVMGNVSAIGNAAGANPATENYKYDPLYRLSAVTDSGTALESYTYNQTGDRLSKTASGLETGTYLYTTGTHQISKIGTNTRANDANGNTTGSMVGGGNTYGFSYNGRNRESLAQLNGATVGTYTYNAMGQRVVKVAATTERYDYDEANKLIGEYGATNRDYIWVGGLPVAVIDNVINGSVTTSTVNYITADQLNTPRAVTNSAGTVIWSWAYKGNPFGEQAPTSSTGYVLNLRYPGQYYDAETATNYNLFRNYEPAIGRYQESDPTGLAGGISTFAYVDGNPLNLVDPKGLDPSSTGTLPDVPTITAVPGTLPVPPTIAPAPGQTGPNYPSYETDGTIIGGVIGGIFGSQFDDSGYGVIIFGGIGFYIGVFLGANFNNPNSFTGFENIGVGSAASTHAIEND